MRGVFTGLLLLGAGVIFAAAPAPAHAQSAVVVPQCGVNPLPPLQVGQLSALLMDPNGNLCSSTTPQTQAAGPAKPFASPGPPVLGRWRIACHCFTNPP